MIAMPLAHRKDSTAPTPFQPLDPAVLSASIPAFFIGRDNDGFWLARDADGRTGGIFLLEGSALAFARRHCWPQGCATIFPSERFELDVRNKGNPLVPYLRPFVRLAAHILRALAKAGGRSAKAPSRAAGRR